MKILCKLFGFYIFFSGLLVGERFSWYWGMRKLLLNFCIFNFIEMSNGLIVLYIVFCLIERIGFF